MSRRTKQNIITCYTSILSIDIGKSFTSGCSSLSIAFKLGFRCKSLMSFKSIDPGFVIEGPFSNDTISMSFINQTPNSSRSNWMWAETIFDVRIVPVCNVFTFGCRAKILIFAPTSRGVKLNSSIFCNTILHSASLRLRSPLQIIEIILWSRFSLVFPKFSILPNSFLWFLRILMTSLKISLNL